MYKISIGSPFSCEFALIGREGFYFFNSYRFEHTRTLNPFSLHCRLFFFNISYVFIDYYSMPLPTGSNCKIAIFPIHSVDLQTDL